MVAFEDLDLWLCCLYHSSTMLVHCWLCERESILEHHFLVYTCPFDLFYHFVVHLIKLLLCPLLLNSKVRAIIPRLIDGRSYLRLLILKCFQFHRHLYVHFIGVVGFSFNESYCLIHHWFNLIFLDLDYRHLHFHCFNHPEAINKIHLYFLDNHLLLNI